MADFDRDLHRIRRGVAPRIVRGCSRRGLLSSTALQAVAVAAVLAMAQQTARAQLSPNAHPMGGQVVAGQAAIAQAANTTTVTQTTARAAVNWQSYSVGSAQTVRYVDPSSSSVTLNRVVGANPSEIAGRITSNGTVMIVNQAGLLFDGGAQINTAGLVVSAAGITNKNFMAGKMVFDQAANPGAKIENRGTITIKNQGLAALVAPQVVNSGVITAKLGKVILAGAEAETLDLYGDGMVSINVTKQVATAPDGTQALVTNSGAISASGGTVLLTARAVDGVVQTLVDAGGKISANSVGSRTGRVVIAGAGGDVEVTGAVAANGYAAGTTGGSVVVNTTGAVRLAATARVSASGPAGGGVVAIGTTLRRAKGGPSVTGQKTAKTVAVAAGATIAANATAKGNGGRVTVLSTDQTMMAGAVDTKGGPQGGDGGFVELSGGVLSLTGLVDASAPLGKTGSLLLDPSDLYVSDAPPSSATPILSPGSVVVANTGTVSWVSPAELEALAANITLSADHDLLFASGSAGANTLDLGGNSLTASAGNNLTIDRGFTINAGGISLTSSAGAITLGGTSGVDAGLIDATQLAALDATSLQGPSVTMLAGTGIQLADAVIGSSAAPLTTLSLSTLGGGVTQSTGGMISAATLMSGGPLTGSVMLAGTANAIASIGSVAVTSGGFSLTDGVSLSVGTLTTDTSVTILDADTLLVSGMVAPSAAGPINVSLTAGNLNLAGVVSDGGSGTTTLIANQGSIGQSGGNLLAGTLTGSALTSVSLTQPGNLVGALGAFATGAGFALADNQALLVNGPVSDTGPASTLALITETGDLTLAGNVSATNVLDLVSRGSISQISGSIVAGSLTGSAATSATLTQASNLVGTLGAFSSAAGFALTDNEALTVTGPVSDTGAASALDLTTRTGGMTLAGDVSASNVLDLVSAGPISQTGGAVSAGTLTLTTTGAGNVDLTGATNQIGASTGIMVNAGVLALVDDRTLVLTGTHSAGQLFFEIDAPGGALQLGSNTAGAVLTTPNGPISLVADTMTEGTAASRISAPSGLVQLAPFTAGRDVSLAGTAGGHLLIDTTLLSDITAGALFVGQYSDRPNGGATRVSAGDISIDGSVNPRGVALELGLFGTGAITEPTGTVTALSLVGSGGSISLLAAGNRITAIGGGGENLTATAGNLSIVNGASLTVSGTVSASGNVYLQTANGTGVGFGAASTVAAGGLASFLTDSFNPTGLGSVVAQTFELAPSTTGTQVTLGGTGATLASLSGIDADLVRIGAVTGPVSGFTITAGSINVAGNFGNGSTGLELDSLGKINQANGAVLTAGTLSGNVGGNVALPGANVVGDLGGFTVDGALTLSDSGRAGALVVSGPVSATNVTITGAPAIDVTGSIDAPLLTLSSGSGGIRLDPGDYLSAGTVDISTLGGGLTQVSGGTIFANLLTSSSGIAGPAILQGTANRIGTISGLTAGGALTVVDSEGLTLAGVVSAGGGGTVDVTTSSGGLTQGPSGTLITGTLSSAGGIFGPAILQGTANQIGTISGLAAGGSLTVVDSEALTLAGVVSAGTMDITTLSGGLFQGPSGMLVAGTLTSSGGISGPAILQGTGNQIGTISGLRAGGTLTVVDSEALALADLVSAGGGGSVDVTTSSGGLTQGPSGTLIAGTLSSSGGIAGPAILQGTANQIGSISGLTAVGTLAVVDSSALTLSGLVSAGHAGTVDITTLSGGVDQGASGTLIAGVLTSSGGVSGGVSLLGTGNQIGSIVGLTSVGRLTVVDGEGLSLAGLVSAGDTGTVDITTFAGGLTQAASGTLVAGALTSSGGIFGAASLRGTANRIGAISGLTAGGTLTVVDSEALALVGLVSAGNTGLVDITTLSGGLTQGVSGRLVAGTLSSPGGIAGPAILQGAGNQIGTISGLTAGGALTVVDGEGLSLTGLVSAGNAGTVDLTTLSGGLTQGVSGTLVAGILSSSGGISGPAILQGAGNQIGSISGLTAGGTLTVVDSEALALAGVVSAGNAGTVDITTLSGGLTQGPSSALIAGTLTSTGGIMGPAILQGTADQIGSISGLTAGGTLTVVDSEGLTLAGVVNAGTTGLIDISVSSGGLTQAPSGALIGGTLTSSQGIFGPAILQGTSNQIGTISGLTSAGALTVVDSKALTLAGLVSAGNSGLVDITTLSGGLTQGPSGTLIAGTLTSARGISGAAILQGTANQIGSISGLTAGGALTVVDGEALSLAGLVSAGTAGIVDITVGSGGLSQGATGTLVAGTLLSSGGVTGSVSLLGLDNQIANLGSAAGVPGSLRATGDIVLNDAVDLGIPGDVVAGNGMAASANASLSISLPAGKTLTINGEAIAASAAGGVSMTAGTIVVAQAGSVQPLVEANGPVTLSAIDSLSQSAGAIAGGSVTLGAPGNAVFSNGTIVANSGTIDVTAPLSTIGAGEIIAALGTGSGISFSGSVLQAASSYIGSNGSVAVGSLLTENGGVLLAVGNIGLGGLSQSGGTIAAGDALSIGQGSGVAGWSGSSATEGAFNQTGGLLAATNGANVFTTGAFTQGGGIVATGGTLGVTANTGIVVDGIVSAAGPSTGFMLLANNGDAVLGTTGLLAGPAPGLSGATMTGNALQAPAGVVQIAGPSGTQGFAGAGVVGGIAPATGYRIAPPAAPPEVPMPSAPSVGAPVMVAIPVQLAGNTIDLGRSVVASTLGLYAATTVTEGPSGLINAGTLIGSGGADIALSNNNVVGVLGGFNDSGHGFWLVDASNLALTGIVSANSVRIEDVGFEIDLTAGSGFAGLGADSSNPLQAGAFPAPGSPGIYLLASNFKVVENPIVSTNSIIDWTFALPETGTGNVGLGDFQQPKVKLFLSLGAGTATGQVDIAGLQITYARAAATTVHLTGMIDGISGQTAASGSHISPLPSNNYQINGCPISSVNCIKFTGLTVPVTNPLQDVEFGDMLPLSDIDIILPDVAERDY